MKDDSLSDVQKHGLEIARKIETQNNLNRYYCSMCDSVVDLPHDCTQFPFADPVNVGITQEQRDKQKYYCVKCETEMNTVICSRCNKLRGYSIREEDVVALGAAYKYESVLSRKIWNEAIEAAAKRISELDDWFPVAEIRKLKK